MCRWTVGFLESGNLKSKCLLHWSTANGDTRKRRQCWLQGKEQSSFGSQKRAARFIDQLGHNTVTLRCDNEPATEALASQTVPERPPMGESQSNEVIERAVGLVASQARTLKAALEHRIGTGVPPDAGILCWLAEFAAYLMNQCDVGSDGKTPLQRLRGRRDNTPILEFGEKILYLPPKPARGGKGEPRFHPGVFVGLLNSSSEAVVVTEQGMAIKTRPANIRRIPESERWDADKILGIRAVPWSPNGSDNAFDIQVGMERPAEIVPRAMGDVMMDNKVARTYLRRQTSNNGVSVSVVLDADTRGLARDGNRLTAKHAGRLSKACRRETQ